MKHLRQETLLSCMYRNGRLARIGSRTSDPIRVALMFAGHGRSTNVWYTLARKGGAIMARNTSVSLGDHFASFVDQQVESGRYGSASDVVRAGLRLLEDHEVRLETLRAEIIKGENSGPSESIDLDAFLKKKHANIVR